jgi:hypothetical protein
MSLQSILIAPFDKGLQNNKKPFLLMDNAFQQMKNAYVWRERVKKREGIKLVGRLRRVLTSETFTDTTPAADTFNIPNIFTGQLSITGEANAQIEPGTLDITIAAPDASTFTDNGDGTFAVTGLGDASGSYVNYASGEVNLEFTGVLTGGAVITADINYFPGFPCMGISKRELGTINVEETVFFDQKYAYTYDGNNFGEMSSTAATTWTGSNSDFFWTSNYRGSVSSTRLFFATNFFVSGASFDPIRYYNNSTLTWAALTPIIADQGGGSEDTLYQAKIIIPYYGRLLALNTYEGTTAGGVGASSNFFNRCRFSQIGDPTAADAWVSDVFGKGGFIDAPTNEAIVSAQFYKNTLIVYFEKSTWNLSYVGEYGLPFAWERTSADLGSESTFSSVVFDDGVLAIGDKAITVATSSNIQRIDQEIPDAVFNIHNQSGGKERVQGVRDFQKEVVFWGYSDGGLRRTFPNRVVVYNYRNNSWALFRDNVTAFGELTSASGISWDSPQSWDETVHWDNLYQAEFPAIVSGNQQGYVHWYQYPADMETTADSNVSAIENESLSVFDITRSATVALQVTSPNHNLEDGEIIYITGLLFVDTSDSSTLTTDLNDRFYLVEWVDSDTINLLFYNYDDGDYDVTSGDNLSFSPATGTGTYMGGGEMTLFPKVEIRTKDFNPFQGDGKNMVLSYLDLQTDATANAAVTINLVLDSASDVFGNLLIGNSELETSLSAMGTITNATQANPCQITSPNHGLNDGDEIIVKNVAGMTELNGNTYIVTFVDLNNFTLDGVDATAFTAYSSAGNWYCNTVEFFYIPGSQYAWHRFYSHCHGQYISVFITYDDLLMNTIDTHQQAFEMNAMQLWFRPGGRVV